MDEIQLKYPLNPKELLWFLSRGYDEAIYKIKGDSIYRAFSINGEKVLVKITPGETFIRIGWLSGIRNETTIRYVKSFINEWFDLDTDLSIFYGLLNSHHIFHYMTEEFSGLKLIGMPDLFEAVCWAIIGQQINLTFAYMIKRRLIEKYGDYIDYEDSRYYIFPTPEVIAAVDPADLRDMQISGSKATYLINIASAFNAGTVSKKNLTALPSSSMRRELLTSVKGIGIWTANYVLMKSLRDQTAVPYGDAGLLNSLIGHGIISNKKELHEMHTLFNKFSGWEAYLVFYLWRSLAVKP